MSTQVAILLAILLILTLVLVVLAWKRFGSDPKWKYTFHSGVWEGYGRYSFVTIEGDPVRYTYTTGENDEIILGDPIDEKLEKLLVAWEVLEAYIEENGPIGSHEITDHEIELLVNAGLTVENNE